MAEGALHSTLLGERWMRAAGVRRAEGMFADVIQLIDD